MLCGDIVLLCMHNIQTRPKCDEKMKEPPTDRQCVPKTPFSLNYIWNAHQKNIANYYFYLSKGVTLKTK